jgi:hypothetical protein
MLTQIWQAADGGLIRSEKTGLGGCRWRRD